MSIKLKKVTLRYSEYEDRIGMFAESADGEQVVIWLTHRLSRMLVQSLCRGIEKDMSHVQRDLVLPLRQHEAESQHQPSEPVARMSVAEKSAALPRRVDVSYSSRGVSLVFRAGDAQPIMLLLTRTEVSQLLSMLYRLFRKAKWPLDVWPPWIAHAGGSRN